jgi:hypothetical protein
MRSWYHPNQRSETQMNDGDEATTVIGVLGAAATFALMFQLGLRVGRRRLLRAKAYKRLRESGEFFFARAQSNTDGVGFEPTVRY